MQRFASSDSNCISKWISFPDDSRRLAWTPTLWSMQGFFIVQSLPGIWGDEAPWRLWAAILETTYLSLSNSLPAQNQNGAGLRKMWIWNMPLHTKGFVGTRTELNIGLSLSDPKANFSKWRISGGILGYVLRWLLIPWLGQCYWGSAENVLILRICVLASEWDVLMTASYFQMTQPKKKKKKYICREHCEYTM